MLGRGPRGRTTTLRRLLASDGVEVVAVLLTFGTGTVDVTAYLRLGHVFASVMTGNLVLLGLAAGRTDPALALATGLAFVSYAAGVAVGARVAGPRDDSFPGLRLPAALLAELAVLGSFAGVWAAQAGQPAGTWAHVALGLAGGAMGVQSAAVMRLPTTAVSTTYLTSTLTRLIYRAVNPGDAGPFNSGAAARLLALAAGAVAGALILGTRPVLVPLPSLLALAACAALSTRAAGLHRASSAQVD